MTPRPLDVAPRATTGAGLAFDVVVDLAAIAAAYVTTIHARLALGGVLFARIDPSLLDRIIPPLWLTVTMAALAGWWTGLYRLPRGAGSLFVTLAVVKAMGLSIAMTALADIALFQNANGLSRAFLVMLFVLSTMTVLAVRAGRSLAERLLSEAPAPERVVIVGNARNQSGLIDALTGGSNGTMALCGFVSSGDGRSANTGPAPVLGTIRDLRRVINETGADRVVVADADLPLVSLAECIDVCSAMHVPLNYVGGGVGAFPTVVEVTSLNGVRLIEVRRETFEGMQDGLKRALDFVVSSGLVLLLSPLFIAIATAIALTSRGPVFYVADRVGRGGRRFPFLKFRSMVKDADALRDDVEWRAWEDGHVFKAPNDARVTPVGRWLRRWSLDELPQLINVLLGDMSLVGPRPLPARDLGADGLSSQFRAWSIERATVRPGITGLWQVRGRSELPFDEMVRLDLVYVRSRSLQLDVRILLETIPVVFTGRGAM